jgi:hypothetical protein
MDGVGETDLRIDRIASERDDQKYSLQGLIRQAEDTLNS